ncbi:MAG: hypothetical protein ACM32O_13715 [Clostridia bacterium]
MTDQSGANENISPLSQQSAANATAHALGGLGGHAINVTYVDNYSTLLLVYSFLSLLASNSNKTGDQGLAEAAKSLTPLLQSIINEEKQYKKAFLEAVESLKK